MTTSDLQPTVDAFHALARSSPWRWRTLHFRHRDGDEEVEAWVRRPGRLVVRTPEGRLHHVTDQPTSALSSTLWISSASEPDLGFQEVLTPERATPDQVAPRYRADGLVEMRPSDVLIDYGDPMWSNYAWVAMLDPVELSHHVDVANLREDEVAGRTTWRADLRALPGYDPRCGGNCCELLYSEAGLLADYGSLDDVPEDRRGRSYPDHYDVALDVQTGVVVDCRPVGGEPDASWLEVDILAVDADLDALFEV